MVEFNEKKNENEQELQVDIDQDIVFTEDEIQAMEAERSGFGRFFDSTKTPGERKEKLIGRFRFLFDAGLLDEKIYISKIEEACNCEDKDIFVAKIVELVKPYYILRRGDTGGVIRRDRLRQQGREEVNDILEYEICDDGKTIRIHVWPEKEPGIRKLKELIATGFRDLAKVISRNEKVAKIEGFSWIIYKHPKLIEGMGFKLGKQQPFGDDQSGQWAEISREDFLKRYLSENDING